jgi:hypothetical protein
MRITALALVVLSMCAGAAEARPMQLGVRITPMKERPRKAPSLCPMLSVALSDHLWIGGGYELLQDYDAILWTSETEGHKPISLSGIRAGAWYRGGAERNGLTYGVGGIFTVANRAFSLEVRPTGLDSSSTVMDFGADFSLGKVWNSFRLEVFATPAWSIGNISSPAVHKNERYNAFTYRIGVDLSWRWGQF